MAADAAFISALRRGDAAAIDQMVKNELPRVYNLCLRLTQNTVDAEDLSQETFVNAVRALPGFKGEAQLSTWLYRIAVNCWKSRVRYEKRRHRSKHISLSGAPDEDGAEALDLPGNDRRPEEWASIAEEHRRALEALNRLDDDDRAVLVLRDIEDRPYNEIALILQLNLGTLKARISRAREKLREIYHRVGGRVI